MALRKQKWNLILKNPKNISGFSGPASGSSCPPQAVFRFGGYYVPTGLTSPELGPEAVCQIELVRAVEVLPHRPLYAEVVAGGGL